ncbi:DUF922 domain-containing protein [Flavisolibacter sp. BT320]|nr:DUF922 domain-containing protein [Flavisolibacter longurius]
MPLDGFDHLITWSEFSHQKTKPGGSDADGYTKAASKMSYAYGRGEGNAIVVKTADVTITMDTKQSWVVESKKTGELLQHEQGHYDITALGVREMYQSLLTAKARSTKALDDKIKKLQEAVQRKINATNSRYDEQTDHSQKKAEQEKWNKAISAEKQKPDGILDNLPQ